VFRNVVERIHKYGVNIKLQLLCTFFIGIGRGGGVVTGKKGLEPPLWQM